jgi:hypothetical protein
MATQPVQSAFGTDTESVAANEKWKQAYNQLLQSLDARQEKPFFDPVWLAAAQGFLTPKKTGSFFEGLGNVAGNIAKAQEAEQNRALETAKARLDLAGMGVQQANQQATARELARRAGIGGEPSGEPASTPSGGLSGTPSGGLAGAPSGILSGAPSGVLSGNLSGNLSGQPVPSAPSPFGDMEPIGQYPVNPNLIKTPQEFYKRAMQGGERDLAAIEKGWTSYQKDFLAPKFEGGNVYDPTTGFMYSKNTGETATATFMNDGENYSIPKSAVIEHHRLLTEARKNPDNPEVFKKIDAFENFWSKGPTRTGAVPKPELLARPYSIEAQEQPRIAPSVAPSAVPPAQPAAPAGGMMSAEARERKKAKEASELAVKQALAIEEGKAKIGAGLGAEARFAETIGGKRGEAAVAEETRIAQNAQNAGKLFTAADTVINSVKESPNYFGVFNKPGALNAIGSTLAEVGKPGGRFTLLDVEAQVVKLMPGTTTKNLLDREKAASALAEIELGYTQTYLAKQGAVTEGERRIVRAIPGGLSSSPQFLELKGKLIKERAQYDININTAYSEYLKVNPRGNALDFQRNSPLYKEIHNAFEKETAKLAGTTPALPTKERQNSGPVKSNAASSYVEDLLKRRGQQ